MFALDTASRALLGAAAIAAFGAAFVTTPIVARGDLGVIAEPAPAVAPLAARTAFADVAPRRDPFAGGDAPTARRNEAPAQSSVAAPAIPPLPQIPAALRALPPNAGAGDTGFPFATGARTTAVVTAVVTGPHPFALIDEAGTTRVLTIGDRIDGDAIAAIDVHGVHLAGGTSLPVAPASGTAATPATSATARPIPGGS